MHLLFLFVLLMYLFHPVRTFSGEYVYVECVYYGTCVDEDSKISSFKPNVIENYSMYYIHLHTSEMVV